MVPSSQNSGEMRCGYCEIKRLSFHLARGKGQIAEAESRQSAAQRSLCSSQQGCADQDAVARRRAKRWVQTNHTIPASKAISTARWKR